MTKKIEISRLIVANESAISVSQKVLAVSNKINNHELLKSLADLSGAMANVSAAVLDLAGQIAEFNEAAYIKEKESTQP